MDGQTDRQTDRQMNAQSLTDQNGGGHTDLIGRPS